MGVEQHNVIYQHDHTILTQVQHSAHDATLPRWVKKTTRVYVLPIPENW